MLVSVTQGDRAAQGGASAVAVDAVAGRDALRAFVELPYRLYRESPAWIPPLRRDEYQRLSRGHNPFFEHATIALWTARRDGRVTGRIAAIDDDRHNTTHGERVTWFGFLEAEDADTARALLAVVERHAAGRGSTAIRGPANPSLNDSVGLLVDGFEHEPYVMMPYNPPEYPDYLESAGYRKAKDLIAWDFDGAQPLGERVRRLHDRLKARHGITVRPVTLTREGYDRDLAALQHVYREAWSDNWGFVPPTEAEMRQLARELRPVVDPGIVLFAEVRGELAGCVVALPDVNQVLKRMNGRLWPFGIVHFLRRRSIIDRARVLLLGVLPAYRRLGLYPLLISELYVRGRQRGYRRAELSWTLEDNELVNSGIEAAGGRRHKTYRLYEKPVR